MRLLFRPLSSKIKVLSKMRGDMNISHVKTLLNYSALQSVKRSVIIIVGTIFQWFNFALFGVVSSNLDDSQ